MKIKDIVYDLLLEDLSKNLKAALSKKWGDKLTDKEIEKFGSWFMLEKERFGKKQPQFVTFLDRFDGSRGFEKFDAQVQNIRDITQYTAEQIKFLYFEFVDRDADEVEDDEAIFLQHPNTPGRINRDPTPEKIEASKRLWYGKKYLAFESGGFRVYAIPNQQVSINFGYYLNTFHQDPYYIPGGQWCTTWYNSNNYYAGKRPDRYFYFVIDESKTPQPNSGDYATTKYHLGALQAMKPGSSVRFRLTDITNPGEPPVTDEELTRIYPQLKGQLDKFVFKPFDETELSIQNKLGNITETAGGPNDFRIQGKEIKRQFIAAGYPLRLKSSWESLDENLKKLYIDTNNENNFFDKFGSYELLVAISKSDASISSLNRRISVLFPGETIAILFKKVMDNEFVGERFSIKNKNVVLYKSKTTKKFGLYDADKAMWLNRGGIKYDAVYSEASIEAYYDENENSFVVETYAKNISNPDNTSFYCIFPTDRGDFDGYFLSHQKWEALKTKLHPEDQTMTDFNPTDDTDLDEQKR